MDNRLQVINNPGAAVIEYSREQVDLIKRMYAKNTTDDELKLLLYMSNKYNLDVMARQIWCVKFQGQPAQIYTGRDGFLEIAHRSGVFNGMESGTTGSIKDKDLKGWCRVYRKDMEHPFAVEADFDEYSTGKSLWASKPKTMIQKVAESQALRRAFSISGIYSPEEMGKWEEEASEKENKVVNVRPEDVQTQQEPSKQEGLKMMVKGQLKKINELSGEIGLTTDDMKGLLKHSVSKETFKTLTFDEADRYIKVLERMASNIEQVEDDEEDIPDILRENAVDDGAEE
jgi:phage recombination protein Bet